jgi:beta-galactosidase
MHDFNADLVRSTHGNYIRWMHISPQRVDVRRATRPASSKSARRATRKRTSQGRQWEQRMEVMRDSMIYFRNNPSILFWEAGNTSSPPEQMQQMVALRKELDPMAGAPWAVRDGALDNEALTPLEEYYGVMMPQDRRLDAQTNPTAMFRGYSLERRDRAPVIEAEDFREEAARRFWDDYSPPHFGFKKGPNDTWNLNSETFCLAAAGRYHDYFINRISNPDPAHSKWSGYASIYWSDSNADGRQDSSEVCASAARWIPCGCPSRRITSIA